MRCEKYKRSISNGVVSRPQDNWSNTLAVPVLCFNDFEWDDSIAAAKQRVATEKQIKRSLVYVTSSDVPESFAPTKLRVFTNVSHTNDLGKTVRSYVSTIEAMKDAEFRAQILANAERDLEQFVNKYDQLTELAGVLDPIKTHLEGG